MIYIEGVDTIEDCYKIGHEVADYVTKYFVEVLRLKAMELEFEKVFYPYLIENKKRYMGLKYEPDGNGNMVCKGVEAKGIEGGDSQYRGRRVRAIRGVMTFGYEKMNLFLFAHRRKKKNKKRQNRGKFSETSATDADPPPEREEQGEASPKVGRGEHPPSLSPLKRGRLLLDEHGGSRGGHTSLT